MTTPADAGTQPPIIVTDVSCDMPAKYFSQYAISFLPLLIQFGDETYRSGVDMTPEQFYQRLARRDVHPTTSQPTVANFVELYQSLGKNGAPIISIHLSVGLSGTVNVARQAAQQLPDQSITVWDSQTLSGGLALQVLAAARAAQAGHSVETILPLLEQTRAANELLFSVDDLSYLYRGGRIGTVRYQIGQVLHIKPVIAVSKEGDTLGTYVSRGRARSLAKAADVFYEQVLKDTGAGGKLRAIVMYGDDPSLAEEFKTRLAANFDCVFLETIPTTPALGVHVGPGALGLGYAPGDWPV